MAKIKIPDALARLGVTQADLDAAMADDDVDGELNDLGNEVVDYAKSISPVGRAEDGDDDPGAYRDAWHLERHGEGFHAVNDDFKAYWVEFGAKHMPEYAVAQKTAEHFGGSSVRVGGVLADERIQNAQGELRVAKAKHRDLIEGKASNAKLIASQERIARLERKRSAAFTGRRKAIAARKKRGG